MSRAEKLKNSKAVYTLYSMIKNYYRHRVGRRSAELAYYLLFAMFPMLLFVTIVLSQVSIDLGQVEEVLIKIVPETVSSLICDTMEYIRGLNLDVLMYTGLVTSVYAVFRAVTSLVYSVNLAYDEPHKRNVLLQILISLAFSVLLLAAVVAALVLVVASPKLLIQLSAVISFGEELLTLWSYLRFALIAGIFLGLMELMYFIIPNRRIQWKQALPGAFGSTAAVLLASIGFSYYVNNMSRYTLLYGSIGAIIILLLWLYLIGLILIMGAELNGILIKVKNGERDYESPLKWTGED